MSSKPPRLRDLAGMGSAIAFMVAGGLGLGWFIDGQVGTSPLLTSIGLAVGIVSASIYLYSVGKRFWDE